MEFQITSSPSSTVLVAGAIAVITLVIGAAFVWFAFSASRLSATLDDAALHVQVPIYGRVIDLSNIDVASARVVNLNQAPELMPRIRTNGIGLPGYAVGWFKLRNGDKALAAVTRRDNVLYLRTTEDYVLLLSLTEPKQFLDALASITTNGN